MAFTTRARRAGGVLVFELSGRLVGGEAVDILREGVRRLLDDGDRAFVLNLARVSQMDSAGLGQVVSAYGSIRARGGHAALLSPSLSTQRLLQIAGLVTVFDVYDDEASAVDALQRYGVDERETLAFNQQKGSADAAIQVP